MSDKPILHIVHCVDTEGPLNETLDATFERLYSIFGVKLEPTKENLALLQLKKIDLAGKEDAIAKCFAPELLKYNRNWNDVERMVDDLLSSDFRLKYLDDFNSGLVYSWHCMDHVGYADNPRHKDIGYGNIFRFYKSKLHEHKCEKDELNWHFHPLSLTRKPVAGATSYNNSLDVLTQILCRRILDEKWFPVVNRPGFHSERPDSHAFLEQWIPFDYANQSYEIPEDQPDMSGGRFGDWARAPRTWRGYHPDHDDYQAEGKCRRLIFRCLNVGTRVRTLTQRHIRNAFEEAESSGGAILSFADHDYRDMRPDIHHFQSMLKSVRREFKNVLIKHSGAEEAAVSLFGWENKDTIMLSAHIEDNVLHVALVSGEIFGPQPYLAIKTKEGHYYHDNFDISELGKRWTYVFDEHTLFLNSVLKIGVGSAGKHGKYSVVTIDISQ
jgi:hypothetical protein